MQTNIITYLCFITICGLLVTDMWLSTNILLQIVCILLVCVVVSLVAYIAHKWHKGNYLSNEQQSNFQGVISDNIALQNELNNLKTKQAKSKINSTEVQQLITFNARLTVQNSNLKTHLNTVCGLLQKAKQTPQSTPVVQLPTEQNQTASNNKKAKTA